MSFMCSDCFDKSDRKFLAVLRIALGWVFLYAGLSHLTTAGWSAKGYLMGAKTFPAFYHWLASGGLLPVVDFLNVWGLTLIGVAMIVGALVRLSGLLGALMMVLYYFPVLTFPKIGANSYLVDDHIVYALAMLVFAAFRAGRVWGIDGLLAKTAFLKRHPRLAAWLG